MSNRQLYFLLAFSGFYFLYTEVLWQRILRLLLGSSTLSNSVVLISIMCGLALGYIISGNMLRLISSVTLLKLLLLINVVFSFFTVAVLRYIDFYAIISNIIDIGKDPDIKIIIFNYAFSLFITVIPCISAGMVIPVAQSFYSISKFSMTYMFYNFGALLGGFFASFISFRYFGLYNGYTYLSLIFLAYAVYVLFFTAGITDNKRSLSGNNSAEAKVININVSLRSIVVLIFILGFSSLAFQTLYFRVLTVIVSNTTYSFSTIVLVYIAGITVGSYLSGKFPIKSRNYIIMLIQVLVLYILIINIFLQNFGGLYIMLHRVFSDFALRTLISVFFISIILLFVPATCINMVFVYLTRLLGTKKQKYNAASLALFYSTAGSVLGIITATFLFIPFIGISRSLMLLVFICLLSLFFIADSKKKLVIILIIAFFNISMLMFFNARILPPSVFRSEYRDDELVYYKETAHGNVSVIRDLRTGLLGSYVDNNAVIGTAYDAVKTVNMLGYLPLFYNASPKDVLVIGFGMGVTSGVLGTAVLDEIKSIEIVPYIYKAAEYFNDHNYNILQNPKLTRLSMDGRIYLNYTDRKYDIISCDPTHPLLGSNSLYTLQYFDLCSARLPNNGIMSQYLPMHFLSHKSFLSIVKSFSHAFDDISIWLSYSHLVILGKKGEMDFNFQNLREIDTSVRMQMRQFGITDLTSLVSNYICNKEVLLRHLPSDIPFNTDSDPFVEFDTFFCRETAYLQNIEFVLKLRTFPDHLIKDVNPERAATAFKAKEYMIRAMMLERENKLSQAIDLVREGLEIYPGDVEMRNYLAFLINLRSSYSVN